MRRVALFAVCCLGLASLPAFAEEPRYADVGDLTLESGAVLHGCRLEYRTFGTLNATKSNAVLFPTWFSGHTSDLVQFVGPEAPVDSTRYFVVLVGALGNGVSSSPSNATVEKGRSFPTVTIGDMVTAEHLLVTRTLGLDRLHAVVGISMGGMQAFEWAVRFPGVAGRILPIVGTPRLSSYDKLLWRTELDAIERFDAMSCAPDRRREVMALVGAIHELALSTPRHVNDTVPAASFPAWLEERRASYVSGWDPLDWAAQLRAMLAHDVSRSTNGSLESAAALVRARLLAIVAAADHMVNPDSARAFVSAAHGELLELAGPCGHLANGCEADRVTPAVREFLARQ